LEPGSRVDGVCEVPVPSDAEDDDDDDKLEEEEEKEEMEED
jgi:hypothetical protein